MNFKLLDTFKADNFYLTQNYGNNPSYYSQFGLLYHEGIDVAHANKTQPVRCVNGGTCLTAYDNAYGRYVVVLDYSQLCATWYCHLSQAKIVAGQIVSPGDVIGLMGSTGNSTGPHVHFNFVLINQQGNRLYKDKSHNMGYLDPLYPRDSSSPKKMGIDYEIEWLDTLSNNMSDTMEISKKDFEKLMANSLDRDALCDYLGYPKDTSLDTLKNAIAGLKSRATDMENRAAKAEAEVKNRVEQVARLETEIDNLNKLKDSLISERNKLAVNLKELDKVYSDRLNDIQVVIDDYAKKLGAANIALAECQAKRDYFSIIKFRDLELIKWK